MRIRRPHHIKVKASSRFRVSGRVGDTEKCVFAYRTAYDVVIHNI